MICAEGVIWLCLTFSIRVCFLMINLELTSWSTISISTETVTNEKEVKVSFCVHPYLAAGHTQ